MDRRTSICFLLVAVLSLAARSSLGADPADFHRRVSKLYDFEPHTLSQEKREAKSNELDAFWDYVKAQQAAALPLLRAELRRPDQSAFFYYDGAKLLLSLSKERPDLQLVLDSVPKADLRGVQHTDYLRTVHFLAAQGLNTTAAALRILREPKFQAFIVQHALTLGQDYSFIYMIFPLEEHLYLDRLVEQLAEAREATAQRTLLLALWYTMSEPGRSALRRVAGSEQVAPETRDFAAKLLERRAPVTAHLNMSPVEALKAERRRVMMRPISDEALLEFDELTARILAKQ